MGIAATDRAIVLACGGSTLSLSLTILVLTFKAPQYGSLLETDELKVGHSDECDEVMFVHQRPFRFKAKGHGPFFCGWPDENTALRASLSIVGVLIALGAGYMIHKDMMVWLGYLSYAFALMAALWLSIATLDADSVKSGDEFCQADFKVDGQSYLSYSGSAECEPGPYVWVTVCDFLCVFVFAGAAYAWRVYAAAPPKALQAQGLNDPFLAATMEEATQEAQYNFAPTDPMMHETVAPILDDTAPVVSTPVMTAAMA